ncbi:hypothetical protein MVEN_01079900 [Mycena venus]|uniref:Uncharacterized protein n=1 Tax=Mycena venus TaxID=2733690 RepID=A0A8H7CZR8_9AGAR|nr:hypothetical protein MVEN_01079900 [Mycena venus]
MLSSRFPLALSKPITPRIIKAQPKYVRRVTRRSLDSGGTTPTRHSRRTAVSTLDPTRLETSDYVDISSLRRYLLRIKSPDRNAPPSLAFPYFPYHKRKRVDMSFPPRTAGYFYFHHSKDLPVTTGAVRFRIASPAKFSAGDDLLRPDGTPWEVTLASIAKSRPALRELLLRDGLVTEAELSECTALLPSRRARPQAFLYRFDQPFSIRFDGALVIQIVVGDQKYRRRIFPLVDQRKGAGFAPYSGRALVRFEVSPLPEHEKSRVVLRVVKIIDQPQLLIPDYDSYVPRPVEGELISRPGQGSTTVKIWSNKLFSKQWDPLRLLLEAAKSKS